MKFSSRTEIDAPPDRVFARLSDFDRAEAMARERGVAVDRLDDGRSGPRAARWRLGFDYRGQPRVCEAELVAFVENEQIAGHGRMDGLMAMGNVELVEFDRGRTRMFCSVELKPVTLRARLLVQSMKLAKGTLDQRFAMRVERIARRIEAD